MATIRTAFICAVIAVAAVSVVSCAPTKASLDKTLAGGIIWPGPPEKPRIRYLWTLRSLVSEKENQILRFVAGDVDYDIQDPKNSDGLIYPQSVFVDSNNVMYVADPGASRVSVVNLETMDTFNITSAKGTPLMAPIGVVVSSDGRIYVSDADMKRVCIFNQKGKLIKFFDGKFARPTGMAIDARAGAIYVVDTWGHTIYVYDLDGNRRGSIGKRGEGPGDLNYPIHVAVDKAGLVYVTDTLNFKVKIFKPSGEPVFQFGALGDTFDTFDKIKGIAVDPEGHIFVSDAAQNMVKIFDKKGKLLLFFGKKGSFYGRFNAPAGIFIDDENKIYVADTLNDRVQVFQYIGDKQL